MSTIIFLLLITTIVAIHEYGHLWTANRLGVPATKFAIGIGPILWKGTGKDGIEYSVRGIPLGGFVAFKDGYDKDTIWWKKALIALAGPGINLLVAFGFLFALVCVARGPIAGLDAMAKLGAMLAELYVGAYKALFSVFANVGQTFQHAAPGSDEAVSGPIGIAHGIHKGVAKDGVIITTIGMFFGLNIGVALLNLVPIPMLDGGRALMALIEGVIGKTKAAVIDKFFLPAGVLLMLALFILITAKDVFNLF